MVRVNLRGKQLGEKPFFKASDFEILKPLKPLKPFFKPFWEPQLPSLETILFFCKFLSFFQALHFQKKRTLYKITTDKYCNSPSPRNPRLVDLVPNFEEALERFSNFFLSKKFHETGSRNRNGKKEKFPQDFFHHFRQRLEQFTNFWSRCQKNLKDISHTK